MNSFGSLDPEYSQFLKDVITEYLNNNIDHFLVDNHQFEKSVSFNYGLISEDSFNLLQGGLRESFNFSIPKPHKTSQSNIKSSDFPLLMNHDYVESEMVQRSKLYSLSKKHRPSDGTIVSEVIPHNFSLKNFSLNTPSVQKHVPVRGITSERNRPIDSLSRHTYQSLNKEFLISKPRSKRSTIDTVLNLRLAREYLDNLVDSICGKTTLQSSVSSLYFDLREEYLQHLKLQSPEQGISASQGKSQMTMNELMKKVMQTWMHDSVQQIDCVSSANPKVKDWKNQISLISGSNQKDSCAQVNKIPSFFSQTLPLSKKLALKPQRQSLGINQKFKESQNQEIAEVLQVNPIDSGYPFVLGKEMKQFKESYISKNILTSGLMPIQENNKFQIFSSEDPSRREKHKKLSSLEPGVFHSEQMLFSKNWSTQKSFHSLQEHLKETQKMNKQGTLDGEEILMTSGAKTCKLFNVARLNKQYNLMSENESGLCSNQRMKKKPSRNTSGAPSLSKPFSANIPRERTSFSFTKARSFIQNKKNQNLASSENDFEGREESFYFFDLGLVQSNWLEYEGQVRGKQKHGQGVWVLGNGEVFHGSFVFDKANGFGRYVSNNNEVLQGVWINNRFQYKMDHRIENNASSHNC